MYYLMARFYLCPYRYSTYSYSDRQSSEHVLERGSINEMIMALDGYKKSAFEWGIIADYWISREE